MVGGIYMAGEVGGYLGICLASQHQEGRTRGDILVCACIIEPSYHFSSSLAFSIVAF